MTKKVIFYLMILWSFQGKCQKAFFLDSLYDYDLSGIESKQLKEQQAKINRLKNDWGLTAGCNITNSFQDQLDGGLFTRIFAKADLWNGGYYTNRKEAESIKQQIKIDSIQGIERSITHNYGIYYNYIIYLYNIDRLKQIEDILEHNKRVTKHFRNLYYNKLIDYNELLELENIALQYGLLQESLVSYNTLFSNTISDTLLPIISVDDNFIIDFDGLINLVLKDNSQKEVLELHYEVLELQYEKHSAPSLSASLGYDISLKRSFYAIHFSVDINTHKKEDFKAQKQSITNDLRIAKIQKNKEILNIQYEYKYKEKQLNDLYMKVRRIEELQHKYEVKKEVLSLEESIQQQKLDLQMQILKYEIIDLKSQLMLLLLRVKKNISRLNIGPYIKKESIPSLGRKFAGNRYLIQREDEELSAFDKIILKQNEIQTITPEQLNNMKNLIQIDPRFYDSRGEMEKEIINIIEEEGKLDFIILDLDQFKQLELRTLNQKDFAIKAFGN